MEKMVPRWKQPPPVPDSLEDLRAPLEPTELPLELYWGPKRVFRPDNWGELQFMYHTVITEALEEDQLHRYLNRDMLIALWGGLPIGPRYRAAWEEKFPLLLILGEVGDQARLERRKNLRFEFKSEQNSDQISEKQAA